MTELERVKEFMDTLEFHGYIDHDLTKLDQLIEDYYPLKQGQTLPLDSVSVSSVIWATQCSQCSNGVMLLSKKGGVASCDTCLSHSETDYREFTSMGIPQIRFWLVD